jgi:hypothetical protein
MSKSYKDLFRALVIRSFTLRSQNLVTSDSEIIQGGI